MALTIKFLMAIMLIFKETASNDITLFTLIGTIPSNVYEIDLSNGDNLKLQLSNINTTHNYLRVYLFLSGSDLQNTSSTNYLNASSTTGTNSN